MIGEVIGKKGEPGTGGGREAFRPGVRYVCSKAERVALLNLTSPDWSDAGPEMELTSELSTKVRKPYYHIVLSWHPHERPTLDQQFAAMHHVLKALGLGEHQIVIGSHGDREHCHIHAIANTVHPISGKVWSKSNDHMKIEKACREIELKQGWAHDRGRFDFDVIEKDGQQIVKLKRNPDAWERKKQLREAGKRSPSPGDIAFEKQHGFPSFAQDIPPALRDRFAQTVAKVHSWDALHAGLAEIGLQYLKAGSGARVGLMGSKEDTKASAFGQKFSLKKLEASFGPYKAPKTNTEKLPEHHINHTQRISGTILQKDKKSTQARSFKMTLLRRIYTGLHLEDHIAAEILFVSLDKTPPKITFKDRSEIIDKGDAICTNKSNEITVSAIIEIAKAKGWGSIHPTGSPDFIKRASIAAAHAGLGVTGVPADVQADADAILEQTRKRQSRLAREVEIARTTHLDSTRERDAGLIENQSAEARRAAMAIFGSDTGDQSDSRTLGRPPVARPQPAPDAAKTDPAGAKRIQKQIRENDWSEIEDMKHVDISIIAALGGWVDVSRGHPDSSDPQGKTYRIFQRGADTIKASRVDGKWLWTSNKSGQSGSVIDLWLHDNPGRTLGHARTAFRELIGTAPFPVIDQEARAAHNPPADHTEARRRWEEAEHITKTISNYATQRGISKTTLVRFKNQVRTGAFGGIYFAHRHPETSDILGFEQRWQKNGEQNKARFAKGGRKTVNFLGEPDTAKRMVVLEGGLDALAIAELEARDDTIYVSTGGGFGPLTEGALLRLADGKDVMSGFDNDGGGGALHAQLLKFLPQAQRHPPPSQIEGSDRLCKDWLDVLNAARGVLRQELTRQATSIKPTSEPIHMPLPSAPKQDRDENADVPPEEDSGQPDIL